MSERTAKTGQVSLVGAGPGDPELLTLRAIRRLEAADVVLHDRLVSDEILAICNHARLINVGKKPRGKRTSQEVINHLLLKEYRAGHRVVRLKGGDPFVFGRGSEEAVFLREHGVNSIEVVPGISSAISAPALAGIPVTHRGVSTSFSVVTGMGATPEGHSLEDDWVKLVGAGGTVVFLMSVRKLPRIVEVLADGEIDMNKPCAFVESASLNHQRVVTGTLSTIVEIADRENISSPAAFVVGDVVRFHEQISSYPEVPLSGATDWVALLQQAAH
jgi:uroporphyrin-III C-methyltransferase